jgi:hypothetical protein
MEIWSNFDHSKVPKYDLVKVDKERALDMNLLFHTTTCTKSLIRIWNENRYKFIYFLMFS